MKYKILVLFTVSLISIPAFAAQYGYDPHAAGTTPAMLNQQLQHIHNFNTAGANAPHLKAQSNTTVGNPNVVQPGTPGYVKTVHPPFAGEAWGNHSQSSSSTGGGSRGNGSDNAQNSHSAGGFSTRNDHIGGGRTGGGFHY